MSWDLFAIDEATLDPTAETLAEAFRDDPLFRFLVPDPAQRRRWLPAVHRTNLEMTWPEGHTYGLRAPEGDIAGGLCLLPPGAYPLPPARGLAFLWRLLIRPTPWVPSPVRALRRGAPYLSAWEQMHPKQPHWYLYLVGVTPCHRGRGAGRRMVEHVLTRAEEDDVPVYLETQTESNLPFYRRLGFRVLETHRPQPEGPPTWGLLQGELG